MSNSTQSRTEKKIKQAPITDFITRKSPPKSITAGKFVIFTGSPGMKMESCFNTWV